MGYGFPYGKGDDWGYPLALGLVISLLLRWGRRIPSHALLRLLCRGSGGVRTLIAWEKG
jgi:hypothetical protein